VRGKVFAIKSLEPEVPAAARAVSQEKARRLFQLSLHYAVGGSEPFVLVVMGRVGTGKTSVAQMIGQSLGTEVFSSDRARKELAGVDPHRRAGAAIRAQLYSPAMTNRTYETIIRRAIEYARANGVAVLDATFGKAEQRESLRKELTDAGIRRCSLELKASDEEIMARLSRREENKTEVSDARLDDFGMLSAAYDPPDITDRPDAIVETKSSVEATVTDAFQMLVRV
jgi:predicted kinase